MPSLNLYTITYHIYIYTFILFFSESGTYGLIQNTVIWKHMVIRYHVHQQALRCSSAVLGGLYYLQLFNYFYIEIHHFYKYLILCEFRLVTPSFETENTMTIGTTFGNVHHFSQHNYYRIDEFQCFQKIYCF